MSTRVVLIIMLAMRRLLSWLSILMVGLLLATSCGDGDVQTAIPTASPTVQTPAEVTVVPTPSPTAQTPASVAAFPSCEPEVGEDVGSFMEEVRRLEIGFRGTTPVLSESLRITRDENIVDVHMVVQYRIRDLDAFVCSVAEPQGYPEEQSLSPTHPPSEVLALKNGAEAALSQVVGRYPIDDILTNVREQIQADIQRLLQDILDSYDTGIDIFSVRLLDVFPSVEVRDAFDDVVRAFEDKKAIINLAEAYEADSLPRARGNTARIIQEAEASKAERIIRAEADVDRFMSSLRAFDREENEALRRLHLEALEGILPGITEFIVAVESPASSSQIMSHDGHILLSHHFVKSPTEQAILVRYSPGVRVIPGPWDTAGLPSVESGTPFDNRLFYVDLPPHAMLTKDEKRLIIGAYALYRVVDPVKFSKMVRDVGQANTLIEFIVISALRGEIARNDQSEIISLNRQAIVTRVKEASNAPLGSPHKRALDLGLEIADVRIKRLAFPPEIAQSIFARMRAERRLVADRERAEGGQLDAEIRADVDRQVVIILAEAERDASMIRSEGRAVATDVFIKVLAKEPELSRYQKSLEAYKISGASVEN